jgi:hypothetical protein
VCACVCLWNGGGGEGGQGLILQRSARGSEIVLDDEIEGTDRDCSEYLFSLGVGFSVDAQRMGNKTRRMNHASGANANVSSQVVNHYGVRKVVMRAKMAIKAGDELRFDYMVGADVRTCSKWRSKLV